MKTSLYQDRKSYALRFPCDNENGAALILSLMFVAILGLLGTTAYVMTTTDMKIGSNYKTSVQSFNAAEAGHTEARARLNGPSSGASYAGDPGATPDPLWSGYILTSSSLQLSNDLNYNAAYTNYIPTAADHTNTTVVANSLQSTVSYLVKIRHKREYDAEQTGHAVASPHYADGDGSTATNSAASPGSIIYYGDDPNDASTNWVEFTDSATPSIRDARPVEMIRAYGYSVDASSIVEIEARIVPLNLETQATLYAKNNVVSNGSVDIDGTDHGTCGTTEPQKPPIYTYPASTTTTLNGSSNDLAGNPPSPVSGDVDIAITEYVERLGPSATTIITSDQNGTVYGSSGNPVTCFSDTSDPYNVSGLKLQGVTGWGLLLVKGDLELGGGFTWSGLILATGTMVFNGGGGPNRIQINGAALANNTVAMNGSVDLYYDSCAIADALQTARVLISKWERVY